jgi:glycosyltransferase involved in cell wall biosynthesis
VKLLSDPGIMHHVGRQAAERVRQYFSIGQMVDRYRDLYLRSVAVPNSRINKQ